MNKLVPVTQVLSKIMEVAHWIAAALLLVLMLVLMFDVPKEIAESVVVSNGESSVIGVYGFAVALYDESGHLNLAAFEALCAGGAIIMGLMAMVFRNMYLILKTSRGLTGFSKGQTFFQSDITRMIREIGIFLLAVAVLAFLFGTIVGVCGISTSESSLDVVVITVGLLMLCLSGAFAQAEEMQQDVEGLV